MHSRSQATRATYDEVAADYVGNSSQPWPDLERCLDRLCAALNPGAVVADVGCGPGRDSVLLRQRGLRVVGLDLSAGMLRAGAATCAVQADMRVLPFRESAFDGLWSQAALLHVELSEVSDVLAGFARVVRPGGSMFLNTAEGDGQRWEPVPDRPDQRRWFVYHHADELQERVSQAGFEVLDVTHRSAKREWVNILARRRARS